MKDPYDDHILELAVSSSSQYIVTYNLKDFQEASLFGIEPVTPETYLTRIGG